MPLPRRKLLLKRSPHNPERPEQWFSRLSVPRLLSGRPGSKDIHKGFLSSGIVKFVNQCFGLLYFVDSTGVGPSVVWNPSTDEERSVPPPGADVLRSPEVGDSLSFASCFGYDAESEDFKVLKHVRHFPQILDEDGFFMSDDGPTVVQYLLYSVKNNRWTDFPCPVHDLMPDCVYLYGNCFWIAIDCLCVVSFSFTDEGFFSFPILIPTMIGDNRPYRMIMVEAVEENSLAFVVYKNSHFQLWTCLINSRRRMPEADDDGRTFVMRWEFWVDFPEECGTMRRLEIGMPLSLYKNGDELLMFMSNSNGQLVYSSASQELKLLPLFSHRGALRLISYHQTSVSLD